jgi:signal transduction histidine kinase
MVSATVAREEHTMSKSLKTITSLAFLALLLAADEGIAAGQTGTSEEAKAMLESAVAALKADEASALVAFTAGTGGFKDRDLYVFCGDALNGMTTAHGADPARIGQSMRDLKDKAGKPVGEEFYAVATEGELGVVEYVWPRPGETEPSPKTAYVTKVGNQICGVGYYE